MRKNVPYNIENPSSEELLAFLKGNMDISDTKKMEQGIENDPLLADAWLGLQEMKSPEKLLSIQQSLNTKIAEQLFEKEPIIKAQPKKIWQFPPTYYAAAASIVLILGFSFFFYNQTQEAKDLFVKNYEPATVAPEMTDVYTPETTEDAKTAKFKEEALENTSPTETKPAAAKIAEKPSLETQKVQEIPVFSDDKTVDFSKKGEIATTKVEDKVSTLKSKHSDELDKAELKNKYEKATQPISSVEANKPLPAPAPMPPKEASYKDNKTVEAKSNFSIKPSSPLPAPSTSANNQNNYNTPSLSQAKESESIVKAESKKNISKSAGKYPTKARTEAVEQKAKAATTEGLDLEADEPKLEKENDAINDLYLGGISKYEAKEYAVALEMFKKIPKNHSYRANADYFSANCYLSLNKQQEAIHLLKPLSEKANWNYQADAKWYLGMAYLANGQKKKAEEVFLKLLEEGGGTRKAEIEKILREMGSAK